MKALLTIEEASELTKLSIKTMYTYAERETVPHIKLGRRVLFEEDKLEDWVQSCRVKPTTGDDISITACENITEDEDREIDSGETA